MPGWAPGAEVDGYRLIERIGAGGQGSVWRAVHTATGAVRAIKATPTDDPELLVRFQREAAALAELAHPNLVRVHTAGRALGCLYLVMDLAPGGDLEARLEEGPLDPEEARRLTVTLARALERVHAHGLLHRDLKPSNVLFAEDGRPLLVDFGLARVEGSSLTQTGTVLGTPAYMAPEQISDAGRVDARADVYGLGAVLFHALTGRPPFVASSTMALLTAVLRTPPPDPQTLEPRVPADLAELCRRALAKDPSQRPPSAAALAAELTSAPASLWPLLGLASALAVAGVVAAGLAWTWRAEPPSAPLPPAEPTPLSSSEEQPAAAEVAEEEPEVDPAASLERLGELRLPTLDDLTCRDDYERRAARAVLALESGMGLQRIQQQLWAQGDRRKSLALLFRVARAGTDAESQRAWGYLGDRLAEVGAFASGGWSQADWDREGRSVVLECFRRGREAGCANAFLYEGELHHYGAEHLGMKRDIRGATRLYRQAYDPPSPELSIQRTACLRLIEFALKHPNVEGVPSYAEALTLTEDPLLGRWHDDDPAVKEVRTLRARLRERLAQQE